MKILYVAPYLPNSLRVRPFRLIQSLSQKHEFTVVGLVQPAWASQFLHELRPLCKEIYTFNINRYSSALKSILALLSKKPMSVAYFSSSQLMTQVNRLIRESKFDLIHTEFIRAAPYTANIKGIPKLFDSVDSLTLAYERGWRNRHGTFYNRIVALEEWLKMRRYEPKMIQSFDRVIVSSPIDKKFLASSSGPTIDIIPNGVDYDYYNWDTQKREQDNIVFVGGMNYYVNVDSILHFCSAIFPLIQHKYPQMRFSIVGSDPKKSICKLAKNPSIEVTGYVPDLRPYLARAAVFVCPLLAGSGIQNKLLQAMAVGTPIVTTSIAIQALQVKDGEHVLVADEPQHFAESVSRLLSDKDLQKQLSINARKYIEKFHDWSLIGNKLDVIYNSMI